MISLLKKYKYLLIGIIFGINIVFSSWYLLHSDVHFYSDIARNYHLFREIDQKKIVLLGPRTSTPSIFHGPAWLYLNYPAYLLSNGNPIIVGWFWMGLIVLFLITSYLIASKLFNRDSALLFVLLLWSQLLFHTKALNNPHGAVFLMPAFFYLTLKFIKTYKLRYLVIDLLIISLIVQFEMAVGMPLLILTILLAFFLLVRKKKQKQFLVLVIGLLPLLTFLVFDLRHDFIQSKAIIDYLLPSQPIWSTFYLEMIIDRLKNAIDLQLIYYTTPLWMKLSITILFSYLVYQQWKNKHFRLVYALFFYYYLGFYILSLINEGVLLLHFVYPLFPLTYLLFISFIKSNYKRMASLLIAVFLLINGVIFIRQLKESNNFFGKDEDSWKFLLSMTNDIYKQAEDEFGYFVYSPDGFAYEARYAMLYGQRISNKKAAVFEKKPVTYIVIAPPSPDNPYLSPEWWIEEQVRIRKEPAWTMSYANGYRINKYELTDDEIQTGFEKAIDIGIHFR